MQILKVRRNLEPPLGVATLLHVLLERGAQVDPSDSEGRTALRAATSVGHEKVVRPLLDAGAQVYGEDRQTPLNADNVARLIDTGAQPDHVDCEGRSQWPYSASPAGTNIQTMTTTDIWWLH